MDIKDISLTQIAALVGAVGTIVGAGFTIDSRYAKNSDIEAVRSEMRVGIDALHKEILENEQLKAELGNSAQAARVLAERNRQELADIRARLNQETMRVTVKKSMPPPPMSMAPEKILLEVPETVDTKPE